MAVASSLLDASAGAVSCESGTHLVFGAGYGESLGREGTGCWNFLRGSLMWPGIERSTVPLL